MSYRFSIVTCLVSLGMSAQSYVGFLSDNYSGVHGILNNPSSIADSRYKLDVNLAGVSTTLGTDLFSFKLNDLASNQFDFSENLTVSNNNNVFSNIDVLGPSLLINLSPKDAIALSTRTRAYLNGYDIDGTTYNLVETSFENEEDFGPIMSNGLNFALNSWAELGFSYARVVVDKEEHFLKAGATIKYLQGIANGYVHLGNLTLGYNTDLNEVVTGGTAVIGASGDIDDITQVAEVFENFDYNTVSQFTGIGLDIGATYEWRPRYADYKYTNSEGEEIYYNNKNKYKVKIGVAITDIGSINYTGINRPYDLGEVLSPEDFEDIEDLNSFEEFFLLGAGAPTEIEASNLPTMFHLNTDWNINNKSLYLNFNADLSTAVSGLNRIRNVNMLTVTPRFERKWFTVQLPVSLQQYTGVQAGFGFRAGPLYLGSGTILTNAFNNASNSFDVYAGLKLPIYQGRPKDTDGDGIDDKQDKCPTEVGPVENGGCPWSDVDKDGVNDALDACPNTAGAIDNRGCPLPDQDEDGIPDRDDSCPDLAGKPEDNGCPDTDTDGDGLVDKEDNCPKIVGPKDNSGCPWPDTDADGVTDNLDNCLTTPGTITNNGCPQVSKEVQKTLNQYARTILFGSRNPTALNADSKLILDEIANIINQYPNSKFVIEGHTDSIGSYAQNKIISDQRANIVMEYLIEQGVSKDQLTAIGYGERRPIATNMYKHGRRLNRRVEINLIK